MSLISELRIRARYVLFPAAGLAAVAYFAWHKLEREVEVARTDLDRVRGERETLERRVRLLYPQSLDPDMLDESARRLLNYGLPDEVVILDPPPAKR